MLSPSPRWITFWRRFVTWLPALFRNSIGLRLLDLLEDLKNATQDTKHENSGYFRLAFETLRNFLLLLLGDKGQEKVFEMVGKVEKNNRRKSVRQNSGPCRRAMAAPCMGVRCYYCNRPGHIQINCFKRKRDVGWPFGFSRGAPQTNVNGNQNK